MLLNLAAAAPEQRRRAPSRGRSSGRDQPGISMFGMESTIRSQDTAPRPIALASDSLRSLRERLAAEVDADPHAAVGAVRGADAGLGERPLRMLARWAGEFIHAVSIWSGL